MKAARFIAGILFYVSRILSLIVLLVWLYAVTIILLSVWMGSDALPIAIAADGTFRIFYPFTTATFLLGDYTSSYLVSSMLILFFYGIFIWLLSDVFFAFRQPKLFTKTGVIKLWRFYITNLIVPLSFLVFLAVFGQEIMDILRITLLHMIIAVFAFFMTAIFKQGLLLQEEQDLIF